MGVFKKPQPDFTDYGPWWINATPQTKITYIAGFLEAANLAADLLTALSISFERMDETSSKAINRDIAALYIQAAAQQLDFSMYPSWEWAAQLEEIYADAQNARVERRSALDHLRSSIYDSLSAEQKEILWQERTRKVMEA